MRKKIGILCFMLISLAFTVYNVSRYEVKEYKSVINSKVFMDPVPNYINKIEILLDANKARISPAYTYRELMSSYEDNWSFAEGSRCDDGNNNIYFKTCPSSTKCDLNDVLSPSYDDQVKGDRYHWVNFEVYSKDCPYLSDFCENDYDPYHLDQVEVWYNGVKINDAVVTNYNDAWHSVDVWIPLPGDLNPLVREVNVYSDTEYVQKGTTSTFTKDIKSYGDGTNNVSWSVIGKESNGTSVNSSGVLTVASNETADSIKVRATSTYDNTVYGEKSVYIIEEPLSISSVTIQNKENVAVVYGGKHQFYVTVYGTGAHSVIWSLTGANKAGTSIDENGKLTVAADETSGSIVVTATSTYDNTKKDTVTVTLSNTIMINKIEINYDTNKVSFSNRTTYSDVRGLLERIWELPENAGYDKGNNNIWMEICPTNERCTSGFSGGYNEKMQLDKYTYANFEIFAKPSGDSNMENPLYDFDANHLEDVEIWVNGVKRDDAFIWEYNSSWREVDVYVPITITNDKLYQQFEFNFDVFNAHYGDSPFKNVILNYNHIGDGEISWSSSDTNVATVDEDGYITIKKIGTCTITAHASETENYNEYSNAYTLNVSPRHIYPSISGYDSSYTYTGSQITPSIIVTYDEIPLVKDVDYTISYDENINTGYGYIYINPVEGSNYTFYGDSAAFYIDRKTIQNEDITINPTSVIYDGNPKTVDITITVDGRTLVKDTDYSVDYSSNTNVGTAYIVEAPEYEKGDMNKDGEIGLTDVISLLKLYLGVEAETDENVLIGDMNEDGEIGLTDVIMLLRVYLGID